MDLFAYDSYRKFLKEIIEARRESVPGFSAAALAETAGVQRSYLSNALHGRAELNADQLFAMGEALNLLGDEIEYLLLLLEIERCSLPRRKEKLLRERDELRGRKLKSERYLEREAIPINDQALVDFFSSPYCSLVHTFMTIPTYRRDPAKIAARLRIPEGEVKAALAILEKCDLIRATKKGYEVNTESRHLSQSHRLSRVYASSFRQKAIEYQQRLDNPEDYFFTTSFSADEETRTLLKAKFLELIKWLAPKVEAAPSEEVFHMNFDLFKI